MDHHTTLLCVDNCPHYRNHCIAVMVQDNAIDLGATLSLRDQGADVRIVVLNGQVQVGGCIGVRSGCAEGRWLGEHFVGSTQIDDRAYAISEQGLQTLARQSANEIRTNYGLPACLATIDGWQAAQVTRVVAAIPGQMPLW